MNLTHQEDSGGSKEGQSAATAWEEKQRNSGRQRQQRNSRRQVLCSFFSKTERNRAAGGEGSPLLSQRCVCQQVDGRVRGGTLATANAAAEPESVSFTCDGGRARARACVCVRDIHTPAEQGASQTCFCFVEWVGVTKNLSPRNHKQEITSLIFVFFKR